MVSIFFSISLGSDSLASFLAGIRKVPMSSVIEEEKADSWLRDELKLGQKSDSKKEEESLKRKEGSDDPIGSDKRARIET